MDQVTSNGQDEDIIEISTPLAQKDEHTKPFEECKSLGNDCFAKGNYDDAIEFYSEGLEACDATDENKAVCYANMAACSLKLEEYEDCISYCDKALDIDSDYVKALLRRASAKEKLEKLEDALEDYQKVLKIDNTNVLAKTAVSRLPTEIEEQKEKMKDEMFSKLKELGNMCLKPFGLSTNNFKMQQDPESGGYSIQFVNNNEANQ